jgi:hypothetical protein
MPARITRTSSLTGVTRTLEFSKYDQDDFDRRIHAWENGAHIDKVLPDISNDAIEFITTGITREELERAGLNIDVIPLPI